MNITFDIDTYKSKFTGGARQYLFFALFNFPSSTGTTTIPYLVKSTSIPDKSFEEIPNVYSGLTIKMANSITSGDWALSFNVDEDGVLLEALHTWLDYIYKGKSYMYDQALYLLDGNGTATQKITLYGAWPKSVGAVGLDYASTDIATVDVTFSYQYYKFENLSSSMSSVVKNLLSSSGISNVISKGFGLS